MGFLKRFRQWCKSRKQLKKLHNIGSVFHALNELEKGGMLSFDINNRRLFIEEPLALVMMTGGAKKWENFIGNCFVWLYHRQCSEAWDQYIKTEELDAVRVASKQYAAMTRADVERVRRVRRDEIMEGDIEPPKVEGFEFFVVRSVNQRPPTPSHLRGGASCSGYYEGRASGEDGGATDKGASVRNRPDEGGEDRKRRTVPAGEILAVGHYDPETEQLELGAWEDVSVYLNREESKGKEGEKNNKKGR